MFVVYILHVYILYVYILHLYCVCFTGGKSDLALYVTVAGMDFRVTSDALPEMSLIAHLWECLSVKKVRKLKAGNNSTVSDVNESYVYK